MIVWRGASRTLIRCSVPSLSGMMSVLNSRTSLIGDWGRYWKIVIRWPDGSRESYPGIEPDQAVVLNKGTGTPTDEQ